MKDIVLFNLAKRLALPLIAALGGFVAGQYPNEFTAFCGAVGI